MSELKTYLLEEVVEKLIDYRGKTPVKTDSGIPLITAKVIKNGRIETPNEFIAEEDYESWMTRGIPEIGDVVLTTEAPLGEVAQINTKEKIALAQRVITLRGKKNVLDSTYLKYFLFSPIGQGNLKAKETGSTVTGIKQSELRKVEIYAPDFETQTEIASILSSLDDKIELNLQMNQTLEAMAQAIFKEWFVNFNFPGFDGELVDGLPKGWKMGKLNDISLNFDSKRIPLSSRERAEKKGIYPYYGAASILDYVEDYIFDGTYLLMGEDGTVVTSEGFPVLQYVWGQFWVNNHTHVLQGKAPFSTEYLFLLLSKTQITHIITGAVQPKINQGNMNKIECVIPPTEILEDFQKIIFPLFKKRKTILDENKTLTQIRDSLLPKLMTGKIEIED